MSLFIIILTYVVLAGGLTWFFIKHDRGSKEPAAALWQAAGFGLIAIIVAAFFESLLISPDYLKPGSGLAIPSLAAVAITVAVIEELAKAVPLAWFIYKKPYFNEYSDGILYFALVGLGFGVPENILYALQFGSKAGLTRLVLTPFFHAATAALVGYFVAASKVGHKPKSHIIWALFGTIVLHALYDFGLLSQIPAWIVLSLMIAVGATASLFILYQRATEADQAAGLSASGHNDFCRRCGQPNPKHDLFCTHCGQRA